MGGQSKQTDYNQSNMSQASSGTVNPWAQAMPALNGILSGINGQVGGSAPTGAEQGALGSIMSNAQGAQNYGGQATELANSLMSGGGTDANAGILSNAYQQYQNQLNPIANQNNDPMSNPGMQSILDTIRSDVGNSVNGMFAGAGRDLSGLNQQALGRGIAQGEAPALLNQYNQNIQNQMGAAGALYGAGGQTAQGLQGFNQQGFQNQATGLDAAMNGIPAAQNNQANQILAAQAQARGLPLNNLGMLSALTVPIAGLGQQTTGNMTGTGSSYNQRSNQASGMQQAQGYANIFGKLFPAGL